MCVCARLWRAGAAKINPAVLPRPGRGAIPEFGPQKARQTLRRAPPWFRRIPFGPPTGFPTPRLKAPPGESLI